jgi:hypothetical protein
MQDPAHTRDTIMDIVDEIETAFVVREPLLQVIPAVVGVPHAGRQYPRRFIEQARLSAQACGAPRMLSSIFCPRTCRTSACRNCWPASRAPISM